MPVLRRQAAQAGAAAGTDRRRARGEAAPQPAGRFLRIRLPRRAADAHRPYATIGAILASALLLLAQQAGGETLATLGGLNVPVEGQWWRFLTAPFAYADVGYLFVVAVGLAIFATGIEQRLGSFATGVLLVACGSLGMIAASAVAGAQGDIVTIAGGNGMALGAVAAWFAIRRAEAHHRIDQEYDPIGVAVAAAVLLALPIFESSADAFAGLAGGVVGALAGLAAAGLRHE